METRSGGVDPWYVTGFVEGEGTFTYNRSGRQMAMVFAVKLTAADEPILLDLREYFGGIGHIYTVPGRTHARGGETKTASYWKVSHRSQLVSVIEHFDRYTLRGKKAETYRIWRRMVTEKLKFRKPDRSLMDLLAAELSASCVRNQPSR